MGNAILLENGLALEEPCFFPPGSDQYFGFVTRPAPSTPVHPVGVVLLGGNQPGCTTIGRNRVWVTTAREVAARGHVAIRFDYPGLGESVGAAMEYDLDRPAVDVLAAAITQLAEAGAERFVLMGTCYGSRTALAGAVDDERVVGLVLLAPPVRAVRKGRGGVTHLAEYASSGELARRALSRRSLRRVLSSSTARKNAMAVASLAVRSRLTRAGRGSDPHEGSGAFEAVEGFLVPLRALAGRGVPVRIVYGQDDYLLAQFERAAQGRLGKVLSQAGGTIELVVVNGTMRGLITVEVQEAAKEEARAMLQRVGA